MLLGCIHYSEKMIDEIIFPMDENGMIHEYFRDEALAMSQKGIPVGVQPHEISQRLIYRGFVIRTPMDYPSDPRYIQGWKEYTSTRKLSVVYPLISDICIPTFFVNELDATIADRVCKYGWGKAFIKKDGKSLWSDGDLASVWPDHSLDELRTKYEARYPGERYAVRKFLNPELFYKEERYWVIMGKIYHRSGIIPDIVKKAASRLKVLGSHYYTIDAIDDYIVEVNPGESSDRFGENSAELFASWWLDALKRH